MSYIVRIITKAASKASKIDPSDAFTQLNMDDAISILKAIFF